MRSIDADALKAYIDAQIGRPFIGCTVGEALKILVDEQPTVEAEPKWIPVSERLPEEGERVLVTHLGGLNPERQVIEHIYSDGKFLCGWEIDMDVNSSTFGKRYMGDVVAWMPLPAPYQGGGTDE